MFGLYLNSASKFADEVDRARALGVASLTGDGVGHSFDTIPAGPARVPGEVASILDRPRPDAWTTAVVAPSMRFVGREWSKALLAAAAHGTVEDGEVLLRPPSTPSPALLDRDALEDWVDDPVVDLGDGWVKLSGSAAPAPRSLLGWYLSSDGQLVLEEARLRAKGAGSQDYLRHTFANAPEAPQPPVPDWKSVDIGAIVHGHRYWFASVGYKAGIISHIVADMHGGTDLEMVDVGSGPGWVPIELLADPACGVRRAVAVDRQPLFGALGSIGARALALEDRAFAFSDAGALGHDWSPCDVVTGLGSLLYLPREDARTVLEQAWDSLRPGGLLIVHENIKQDSFKGRSGDYDLMFTSQEVDDLLGRFGPIRRFASTGPVEVAAEAAGAKAVFRVVQKD